ncbi:MAG TPA: glutamine synthetase beta-grasp domain-containing protein [bacterium]|jgi:glutamine synthetase
MNTSTDSQFVTGTRTNGEHAVTIDPPALPASKLARLTGKPNGTWTVDDLVTLVREEGIRLISLMHVGGDGWLKTLDFAPRDESHLRDILTGGERCDGSSIFGMMGINAGASDIILRPRVESAFLDPFADEPVLVLLCGHCGRDGKPLVESPDTIVRLAVERLKRETGIELQALGEVEYFLGKRPSDEDVYGSDDRGYHASSPFVFGEDLRRAALAILAEMGVPIKYGHSEVGYIPAGEKENRIWEQHEIEMHLQPLPQAADAVVLTQWVLRNLAHAQGMRVSFEPVVRQGHAGNGLHFHCSPTVNGQNLSLGKTNEQMPAAAKWLIGGLVRYGGVLMAFGNREGSSFLRLSQAKEAPSAVTWGRYNRKALVRIPIVATDEHGRQVSPETIEFRLSDGSAHPHLLLAGIAQVMTAGKSIPDIDKWLYDTEAGQTQGADHGATIPKGFDDVAVALRSARAVFEAGQVFPAHVLDRTIEGLERQKALIL